MTRKLKKGGYMALFTIVVVTAIIIANLIIGKVPARYKKWDLNTNRILILGDITKDILSKLGKNITIYIMANPDLVDEKIKSFVSLYADQSPHIRMVEDDPILHPDVLATLDAQPGQALVVCKETGKKTAVSFNGVIQIDLVAYYQYQRTKETAFDGEGQIINIVSHVTNNNETTAYTLTGHQESALLVTVENVPEKSGMILSDLNPMTDSTIPQDCGLPVINNSQTDINQDEVIAFTDYLKSDGHLLFLSGVAQNRLANLSGLCSQYGMDIKNEFVADSAPRHSYNNNLFYVVPEYDFSSGLLGRVDSKQAALAIQPSGMTIQKDLRGGLTVAPSLTTSDSSILVDLTTQEKIEGTYVLAAVTVETVNEEKNTAFVFTVIAAPELISDNILINFSDITNLTMLMSAVSYKMSEVTTLSVPSKSLDITYSMIALGGLWSASFIIVIPVVFLITGFVVWIRRHKL